MTSNAGSNLNTNSIGFGNKTVDKDKLKAGKYNVAIVFSSSIEGDYFRGAVGSTLHIEEVELIHAAD